MSLSLQVFGSSSAGNATILWNRHGAVLVDCGFGVRFLSSCLRSRGFEPSFVRAVMITHTHSDHVKEPALRMFLNSGASLHCTEGVKEVLAREMPIVAAADQRGAVHVLGTETEQVWDGIHARAFDVPHDARGGCSGFVITGDSGRRPQTLALATDLGFVPDHLPANLWDADALILESNHDVGMLEYSGRPQFLIDRIRSVGHLSNDQSAQLLSCIIEGSTKLPSQVILAHLSVECNTPELAVEASTDALKKIGASHVCVAAAAKNVPGHVVQL